MRVKLTIGRLGGSSFLIVGHFGLTRLAFFFEAETFSADIDDRGAMQQAVEGGTGEHGVIGEDLAPLAESLVAGQRDRLRALVALADDLEQQAQLQRIEREVCAARSSAVDDSGSITSR
jgi:hypothetical protein